MVLTDEGETSLAEDLLHDGQGQDGRRSNISSPELHEYGVWGTRPALDKDSLTHQKKLVRLYTESLVWNH
jgi:hypothetical protein